MAAPLLLFNPAAACTVQWIIAQTSAACTIQLLLNGQPFGAALDVGAKSIIRFAGTLLVNNEQLSLSVTATSTITYEVVWLKDFHLELIETETTLISGSNVNIFDSTGLAVTAASDAPIGTESALITRDIFRKKSVLETAVPLAANGVFTGAWHDTELDGTMYVACTAVSNVAGLGNGMQLQESEDQVVANLRLVMAQGNATTTRVSGFIRARYWRVVYTNAGTIQASFTLYATSCNMPIVGSPSGIGPADPVQVISGAGNVGVLGDGIIAMAVFQPNQQNVNTLLPVADFVFNGASMDKMRGAWNTTTGDTGAKVATFNGATQTNFDSVGALITILLGAVSGTTPTLAAQLQFSPDGGTTWLALGAVLPNLTATSQNGLIVVTPRLLTGLTSGATVQVLIAAPLPRTWRLVYTIAGTTPSFAINSVNVNYTK